MKTAEYGLVQNPALGALCLWHFVNHYEDCLDPSLSPELPLLTCVLPIVYHQETLGLLWNRRFEGGLLNARTDDRTLGVGLQERMTDMLKLTFESINIALSKGLLVFDNSVQGFSVGIERSPKFSGASEINRMIGASKRLGYWFRTRPLPEVCSLLRIFF